MMNFFDEKGGYGGQPTEKSYLNALFYVEIALKYGIPSPNRVVPNSDGGFALEYIKDKKIVQRVLFYEDGLMEFVDDEW